jgi:LmbE family N-acetylglucosaminyl deacetylase
MATIVTFHAHPDDEVIATGGTIARAADAGHRVVLVVATGGEHGEVPDDLVGGLDALAERRRAETEAAAAELGIHRIEWLGYRDSGMTGWEANDHPDSFHRAEVAAAARRLASLLAEEDADVLTIYDWHGNYGHPDHVQVHRVGVAAAGLVSGLRVLEATINRDDLAAMIRDAGERGVTLDADDQDFDPHGPADDGNPMGMPEAELTLGVDVAPWLARKRAALRCHRSQVTDTSLFLQMPEDLFARAFGTEWFIEHGVDPPSRRGWIFDDI